jgi:thymidylate synthase (FAD)
MKIITEASVYVVGRQSVSDLELHRFLADHDVAWESDSEVASEVLTETAGRVCYMSFAKPRPGGNSAYLQHIKEVGHGSVVEHAVWNLIITGVSRSLSHELVRHRAGWAYSQLSQRYVDSSEVGFVVPHDLAAEVEAAVKRFRIAWCNPGFDPDECQCLLSDPDITAEEFEGVEWIESVAQARISYERRTAYLALKAESRGLEKTEARKFARQAARSVLPNATETKLFVTANGRALRHFLELRGSRHAEPEIRKLAVAMLDVLAVESPNLFGDYRKASLPDGTFEITTDYKKV